MGDKFENEELLKYSFPEDIWFHVDALSSAHVYLRLPLGSCDMAGVKDKAAAKKILMDAIESVPADIIQEMCQLTKANSFRLLLKHIEKDKDVVKRLEKTRTERKVDF